MARSRFTENFNVKAVDMDGPDSSWVLPSHFVGVEFEIENTRRFSFASKYYEGKEDGSLRGGREYVFSRPLAGSSLTNAINEFYDRVEEYDPEIRPVTSYRTGLHVHLNFSRGGEADNIHQVRTMVAAYYLVEGLMYKHAGVDRKWCGYCWSFSDADGALYDVLDQEKNETEVALAVQRSSRYYGLNLRSLSQHGTMEFRHMEMTLDRNRTVRWINSIFSLRKYAESFGTDEGAFFGVLRDYEASSPEEFVRKVFGNTADDFIVHLDESDMDSRAAILRNCISEARTSQIKEHRYLDSRNPVFAKMRETSKPVATKGKTAKTKAGTNVDLSWSDFYNPVITNTPTPVEVASAPTSVHREVNQFSNPFDVTAEQLEDFRRMVRTYSASTRPTMISESTPSLSAPRRTIRVR